MDYSVTEMGCFDDYSDAAPQATTMRGNCIHTFHLHVSQCITLNHTYFVLVTLISKSRLKSLYSRLGFKIIKYFATSPNFEEARKQFHYESGKSKEFQKQTIVLRCYQTILRNVTIIHDNLINFN